jgi:hypothetical protein
MPNQPQSNYPTLEQPLQQQANAEAATKQQIAQLAITPAPVQTVAPALPVTHQDHPFWQGFTWERFLQALQVAAAIATPVVAVATHQNPAAINEASQLSSITGTLAGALLNGPQTQ